MKLEGKFWLSQIREELNGSLAGQNLEKGENDTTLLSNEIWNICSGSVIEKIEINLDRLVKNIGI